MKVKILIACLLSCLSYQVNGAIVTNLTTSPSNVSNIVGNVLHGSVVAVGTNNTQFTTTLQIISGRTNTVITDLQFKRGNPSVVGGGIRLNDDPNSTNNASKIAIYTRQDSGLTSDLITLDGYGNIILKTNVIFLSSLGPKIVIGTGSPETIVEAPVGSIFLRTDGGTNTTFYVKEVGTNNTGWTAK